MPTEQTTLPPHSTEAEQGVLGCILLSPECIDEAQAKLKAGAKEFFELRHQRLYAVLCAMRLAGGLIDSTTVHHELTQRNELDAVGGFEYFISLPDKAPGGPGNLPSYLDIVHEQYLLRRLQRYCASTSTAIQNHTGGASELLGKIQTAFANLEDDYTSEASTGKDCAKGMIDDLEKRRQLHDAGQHSGILTGFWRFDQLTDGLQPGELAIIAARPSIGKTAIALDIVRRACILDRIPTLFCTLEMSRDALMRRLFASHCSIPLGEIKKGLFTQAQFTAFTTFSGLLAGSPLYVEDGVKGMTISELSARARRIVRKHGVKLIVVDYLQKIRPDRQHEKKTYEVAQASEGLVALARGTGAAVLAIAALNREPEKDKGRMPRLGDLAHCGQIEFDADLVALLHRDRSPENTEAKLIVAKQRDGETDAVQLEFVGKYCRFQNPPMNTPQQKEEHAD